MNKTILLVVAALIMIIDTKFDLLQGLGMSEQTVSIVKLIGAVGGIVVAKMQDPKI